MKEFLFLFRGGMKGNPSENPELWQEQMTQWKAWMDGIAAEGRLDGGRRLTEEGVLIEGATKKKTDGPYAEGKEVVGGYLVVKAADMASAVETAEGCPIYRYEGSVEVRELLPSIR
ncbi:YciI family protein [Chitinophagaceae bacterium MMS25-I14]